MQLDDSLYWSIFFNEGFFGFSKDEVFKIGSLAHIIPILLFIFIIFLIYKFRNILRDNSKLDNFIMSFITIVMIFSELIYWWRLTYVGPANPDNHNMFCHLPIQVCQWTLLLTVCFMITKSKDLFGTIFFLTTIPSLFALIYPKVLVHTGPTYCRYYQYWLEHLMPIIAVYYMLFVHKYKVKFKHILYALFVLSILFVIACKANTLIDEVFTFRYLYMNYMREIPFLTNTSNFELYIYCIIFFFSCFYIIYIVYRLIEKKNEKNSMD